VLNRVGTFFINIIEETSYRDYALKVESMNLPKGWEEKELGDVCELVMGQSPPSNTYNEQKKGLPFFQGKAEFGEIYPSPIKWCSEPVKIAQPRDTLMSVRAPVGAVNLSNIECCIGRGLAAIRPGNKMDYKFLYYFLKKNEAYISSLGQGSTFTAIGKNILAKIRIDIPPLPAQRKIVAILEKAEAIKQKRQQIIEHSNKVAQSVFLEMFGDRGRNPNKWALKPIKDYVERTETRDPKLSPEKSFLYVDIASVDNKVKLIIEPKELLGIEAPSRARKVIREGDILVSTVRPNLNAVAIVPRELDNQICSTGFCVLRCKNSLERKYLFELTKSAYFVNHLVAKATGASYPAVSDSIIQNTPIPIPPIELQRKFAGLSEKIAHATLMQAQSEKFSEELFNSLMQKAFTGELIT